MDLSKLMKQAQAMQAQMEQLQADLAARTVTGTAAGGMVTVEVDGKGAVQRVRLDPQVVDPSDVAGLEDLITVAARDAQQRAEQLQQAEMAKVTGGLGGLGGLNLPF